jgi:uncharacterized protein (DUF2236 family)
MQVWTSRAKAATGSKSAARALETSAEPACLFIFYEGTHQLLHGTMAAEQAENLYQSAMPIGTTLQVIEDQWPSGSWRRSFVSRWIWSGPTDRRRFEHLFLFMSFVNRIIARFIRTYNYTILKDLRRRIRRQKSIL